MQPSKPACQGVMHKGQGEMKILVLALCCLYYKFTYKFLAWVSLKLWMSLANMSDFSSAYVDTKITYTH